MQSNKKENYSLVSQIPNIFTLLNLFFGCLAIVYTVQTGLILTTDLSGDNLVVIPEKICIATMFIAIAAVVDFFDGFIARLLGATSDMGKQLDSLADVVSFGVAPGMIIYQFLRLSFAQQPDGLDVNTLWLMPAFILPCAGAYRLGRFNIDTEQSFGFKGVPIPAAGLFIASFPLIYRYNNSTLINSVLTNHWFWYVIVFFTSYLMVSKLPMQALKFKNPSIKSFLPFIIIGIIATITAVILRWIAVPITFAAYITVSLVFKQNRV